MRGIILAGGTGSRLYPCTRVTSKHLLAVFNKPMLFYPLDTLITTGIQDILVITGKEHMGDMLELLGSGSEFGVDFTYRVQDSPGGISEALLLAESFANEDSIAVILGDNLFEDSFKQDVEDFIHVGGAKVFLKEVPDPERFGIAEVEDDKIIKIIEKPVKPKSNLAVTGFYLYDWQVFDIIKEQDYSPRGELEITHTNQRYLQDEDLEYRVLQGYWSDMGTPGSLLRSANFLNKKQEERNEKA